MCRDWLLERLLAMQIELVDAQNTAEDLRAALAHLVEDDQRELGAVGRRVLELEALVCELRGRLLDDGMKEVSDG